MPKIESSGTLEKKSIKDLVAIFNANSKKKVKTFRDKKSAVRRVLGVLADSQKPAAKKTAKKAPRKTGEIRDPSFDLKPARKLADVRENTKRARVIQMLAKGATIQQVMSTIGWDRKTAFDGIKLLNTKVGYGLKSNDKGVIRLVRPKAG